MGSQFKCCRCLQYFTTYLVGRVDQQKLSALVLKTEKQSTSDTPESQLKEIALELSNKRPAIPDYGNPFPNPWVPVAPKLPANSGK